MKPLEGRVAVVIGASRGIGMGSALELGAAGAIVYAVGRTLESTAGSGGSLRQTVSEIEELGGRAVPVACDCTDPAALEALFGRVAAEQGRLDVLVNSVFSTPSFSSEIGKRFWETSSDIWRTVVDIPTGAAYNASSRAAPLMIESAKTGSGGLIVNVSGRGAVRYRYNVAYGIGKSAMERLTRDAAIELRDERVAVISIWPNGHAIDPSKPETPRYNGRAVASLAADPKRMAKSGDHFWSAALAAEYDFTDEFGRCHPIGDLTDSYSLEHESSAT